MKRTILLCLLPVPAMLLFTLAGGSPPATAQGVGGANGLTQRLQALESTVADLEETVAQQQELILELQTKLAPVELSFDTINDLSGPHLIFEGVNVHVRNGAGATGPDVNGLGNLVVGYNETGPFAGPRGGSHNLVVGPEHGYSSFGGLVAGFSNNVSGISASVSGGIGSEASGDYASVSGGEKNIASGGGSSVSGGVVNTASGTLASVSGGSNNVAGGISASVSGGLFNEASGDLSSVSGGLERTADGEFDWRAGGLFEDQ